MNGCAPDRATERAMRAPRERRETPSLGGRVAERGRGWRRTCEGAQQGRATRRPGVQGASRGKPAWVAAAKQHQHGSLCPASRRWPAAAGLLQQYLTTIQLGRTQAKIRKIEAVRGATQQRLSRLTTQTTRLQLDREPSQVSRTPPSRTSIQHLTAIRATIVTYAKTCTVVRLHARTGSPLLITWAWAPPPRSPPEGRVRPALRWWWWRARRRGDHARPSTRCVPTVSSAPRTQPRWRCSAPGSPRPRWLLLPPPPPQVAPHGTCAA